MGTTQFILSMILWVAAAAIFQHSKNSSGNKDLWGWACVDNTRSEVFSQKISYSLVCRLQNWTLICIVIEIVVEVICIALYSVVFYRYYSKRRLYKSMDLRDRARSDLYLAQLRSQSAPNTPGLGPKSPSLSHYALSPRQPPTVYRSFADADGPDPFTPGGRLVEPPSRFAGPGPGFRLQSPPIKAPPATRRPDPTSSASSPLSRRPLTPTRETMADPAPAAAHEPTYEAVPIPCAYLGPANGPS